MAYTYEIPTTAKAMTYWAWARHNGKVELLRVTRGNGKSSQEWMGQTFKSDAAAAREVARLNGCAS